jgi:hypothetical protein
MKKKDFKRISSEKDFVQMLKERNLYREDDVTFEELGSGKMYVYTGDNFEPDPDVLGDLELTGLLVDGTVRTEFLSISDVLEDIGVFCVSGDVTCKDLLYMTESTGVVVGGNLQVENVAFADCGNSVLQVNKDLRAKLFFNAQCSLEVAGKQDVGFDEDITAKQLATLGIHADDDDAVAEAISDYFEKYDGGASDDEDEDEA